MEHIGIDLGASHSHIAILNALGERISQTKVPTSTLPAWLASRNKSRVVMEACTQSPAVARAGEDAGHTVTVVPGQLVRAIGIGRRGIKTDDRDALVLAEASHRIPDLPGVHLRSKRSAEKRFLLSARQNLLDARKAFAASCKSFLRGRLQHVTGRANSKHFSEVVRKVAAEHPDGLPLGQLAALKYLASDTLRSRARVANARKSLELLAMNESATQRLIPVLGKASSAAIVAEVGDLRDFDSPASLVRCLGLNLKEVSSGQQKGRLRITKRGSGRARHYLFYAALRRIYREPIVRAWYAKKRARSSDAGLSGVIAVMRKLAAALWHMARGAEFDAEKLYNTKLLNLGDAPKDVHIPTDGIDEELLQAG